MKKFFSILTCLLMFFLIFSVKISAYEIPDSENENVNEINPWDPVGILKNIITGAQDENKASESFNSEENTASGSQGLIEGFKGAYELFKRLFSISIHFIVVIIKEILEFIRTTRGD